MLYRICLRGSLLVLNETRKIEIFVLKFDPPPRLSDFSTYFSYLDEKGVAEAPKCPKCGACIGSLESLPPFQVELEILGKGWGDLAFGPGDALLVSSAFKESFETSGLRGLSHLEPVKVVSVKGKNRNRQKKEYFHAKILRSNVRVDLIDSGMEELPTCNHCLGNGFLKRIKKVGIQPESWNGEDIFFPLGLSGTILTTQSFFNFCQKHSFSNVVLIPGEKYQLDFYPWEKTAKKKG